MSDTAVTIIVVVALILSSPAWVPVAYLVGMTLLCVLVALVCAPIAGAVWLAIVVSEMFERRAK